MAQRLRPSMSKIMMAYCLLTLLVFLPGSVIAAEDVGSGTSALHDCPVTLLMNKDYYDALRGAIDSARSEIVMAFYLFKTDKHDGNAARIVTHLTSAVKRGVRVEVLLERGGDPTRDLDAENRRTRDWLRKGGVTVTLDSPERTTHTKLVVIDRRLTFIGSHNLTQAALTRNNEISVLIDSTRVAEQALRYIRFLYQ